MEASSKSEKKISIQKIEDRGIVPAKTELTFRSQWDLYVSTKRQQYEQYIISKKAEEMKLNTPEGTYKRKEKIHKSKNAPDSMPKNARNQKKIENTSNRNQENDKVQKQNKFSNLALNSNDKKGAQPPSKETDDMRLRYLNYVIFSTDNTTDGQAQHLQLLENDSDVGPFPVSSLEPTFSNRSNIHQHTEHKKGLFIAALNINGLRRHLDEISSFINEKGIHVLALNETKLDNSYSKQLTNIVGYQQERKDRNSHGGGVALYIREPIQYTRRTDLPFRDLELICVEIQPPKSKPYIVITWYRPPNDPADSLTSLRESSHA